MSKIQRLAIDKMGWPVEFFEGKPIVNFLRRLIHTDHYECRECWYSRQAMKRSDSVGEKSVNYKH